MTSAPKLCRPALRSSIIINIFLVLLALAGGIDAYTLGSAPSPRYDQGFAATSDGVLYVFGGYQSISDMSLVDDLVYSYNPATNTWTTIVDSGSKPAYPHWSIITATPDGKLYVFGGNSLVSNMYSFSPETSTWTQPVTVGAAPSARCCMGFTSTPDGKLYVFGGADDYPKNDLYSFCPQNSTWTNLIYGAPPSPRQWMGCTATPDGMVYVFGGISPGQNNVLFGDLHRFDPANNVWTRPVATTGSS
jgi:N-acetylneuraminic acid mutarotase